MRLLNVEAPELELDEFLGDNIPPYAILSHTWGKDEVLFRDLERREYKHKLGYKKIKLTCDQARKDNLKWCWVDTCCIDKSSSAELSEAINSMFNWYKRAQICYAYLADVCVNTDDATSNPEPLLTKATINTNIDGLSLDKPASVASDVGSTNTRLSEVSHSAVADFSPTTRSKPKGSTAMAISIENSRWFTRGWTLQELIAPRILRFYDTNWHCLGDRDKKLLGIVRERTGLDLTILGRPSNLQNIPLAQRMSWMAKGETTRKEDEAYCLLGIFGVNMPLLYGEEDMAFIRLQEELIKRSCDHSLLIFLDPSVHRSRSRRILATSPKAFEGCKGVERSDAFVDMFPLTSYHLTDDGIRISLPIIRGERSNHYADLAVLGYSHNGSPLGLVLNRGSLNGEVRYVLDLARGPFGWHTVALPWLGSGIVSTADEITMTAQREQILFRAADHSDNQRHRSYRRDSWLRYDSALQFKLSSLESDSERKIAQWGHNPPPHMIRLGPLQISSNNLRNSSVVALKFLLEEIEPRVIVAVFSFFSWETLRGALLVVEDSQAETREQLEIIGATMCNKLMDRESVRICMLGGPLASVYLDGIGMLDLRHDGIITELPGGPLRLSRVTLCIRRETYETFETHPLSDGTEEKLDAEIGCQISE